MTEAASSSTQEEKSDKKKKTAPKFIFIHNTSKRLHGVGKAQPPEQKGVVTNPINVSLKPGLNKVDVGAWEEAKKQKMVQLLLAEDILREMATAADFRGLVPDEARKLIGLSNDLKMLQDWQNDDPRKEIQKALVTRIEFLEQPEPGAVKPDFGGNKSDEK